MRPMGSKLKGFGRFIRTVRAARFYHNGDGAGLVWNWWHPLAWLFAPLSVIISIVAIGAPETWRYRHDIGIGMNPYFKKHPERLVWDA